MPERHPIRNQVVATLIAAAIIGAVGWLSGSLGTFWRWAVNGSVSLPRYVAIPATVVFAWFLVLLIRLLVRWRYRRTSMPHVVSGSVVSGLELRPTRFTVDLTQRVPRVSVELLAINYLPVVLSLRGGAVSRLSFGADLPHLDTIPLNAQPDLAPSSSFSVFCERSLVDAEARELSAACGRPINATISVSGFGLSGGKEVKCLKSSLSIAGWVLCREKKNAV